MRFTLKIDCGNAAFSDGMRGEEVARTEDDTDTGIHAIRDINGNVVGDFGFQGARRK
jgi:hypothetical protein